ncbi:MAG: hypothetical protein OEL55_00010 [Desulfobulbaceae bacterium]|nr:hypothetical protein [Desulfobulbaceae bacterium]
MESKEDYRKKIEAQLKEWGEIIEELKNKASKAAGELKKEHESEIKTLVDKKNDMQKQLKEFISSSDDAWKVMRKGLEKAATDIKKAFKQARKKYK